MNVLFVPSIGLDVSLLERLANSVDYPVAYKIAWNNGPLGALEAFASRHPDWIVKDSAFGNLGCAGSWNECAKLFPDEPTMLLMNEDAWFLPGYLEKICGIADTHQSEPILYLNESQAYYCFVWTKTGREAFGMFDDNLWPAYYEDVEMRIRHQLTGIVHPFPLLNGLPPLPHGKPRTGGVNYNAMLQGCGLFNRAYMLRKWGWYGNMAHHTKPYNDHRLTYRDVVWYPEERAMRHHLWTTFMSMNPSIYE